MQGFERQRDVGDPLALTPAEQELEWALGALAPGAARGVDRSRALFDAGVAVGRRKARSWQGATGAMAVALIASLLMRLPIGVDTGGERRGAPETIATVTDSRPVQVATTTAAVTSPVALATRVSTTESSQYILPPLPMPSERPGYLQLRDQVLLRGQDALRPADAAAPLRMPDPAARRVLGPAAAFRG
jgi:hypothetical protein